MAFAWQHLKPGFTSYHPFIHLSACNTFRTHQISQEFKKELKIFRGFFGFFVLSSLIKSKVLSLNGELATLLEGAGYLIF